MAAEPGDAGGEHASARELANLAAFGGASQHGTVLQLVPFVRLGLDGDRMMGEAAFPYRNEHTPETPRRRAKARTRA
jgi:hypothetical protein